MPLPCRHFRPGLEHRPARAVDHDRQPRDLRLGGDEVEERRHRLLAVEQVGVHVHVEQVRAAAHLLERDVDGLLEVASLDQPAEARRAGDVRALADHHEVRVRGDRERLEAAEPRRAAAAPGDAAARRRRPQPRSRARAPASSRSSRRRRSRARRVRTRRGSGSCRAAARRARRTRSAAPRSDSTTTHVVATRERSSTNGRISVAPSEQLTPTTSGSACSIESQNASTVCPERLRPLRSTAVNESQSGHLRRLLERGDDRRLRVERVEDGLDQEDVHPAVAQRTHLLRVRVAHLVERDRAERRVVDTRRERERDVERPDGAGDEARLSGVRAVHSSAARRASRAPSTFISQTASSSAVVGLADRRRGERVRRRDVRAGLEVVVVDPRDDLRTREVEQVGIPGDVSRVVAEALAAVGVLAAHLALDEHAPGAVEDGDPLAEDCFESFACVRHVAPDQRPYAGSGHALSAL